MSTSKTLNEAEIETAIFFWMAGKGLTLKPQSIHLWQDPGDPPVSGPRIFARMEIEEAA